MSYFTLHQQSTIIGWWLIYCVLFLLKLTIHILNYKFQLDFDNQVNRTPAIEYVGYYIMVHFDIKANLFLVSEKAHWSFPEKLIVPPMLRISFCFKSWSSLDFQSNLPYDAPGISGNFPSFCIDPLWKFTFSLKIFSVTFSGFSGFKIQLWDLKLDWTLLKNKGILKTRWYSIFQSLNQPKKWQIKSSHEFRCIKS